jgi:hypothetical protein
MEACWPEGQYISPLKLVKLIFGLINYKRYFKKLDFLVVLETNERRKNRDKNILFK